MKLTSPAFEDGNEIPWRYSAMGGNDLPPLYIEDAPEGTRSLALVFEDQDSPLGHLTHWLVWNLPPDTRHLDAIDQPEHCMTGRDAFGKIGYTGPALPEGLHHYRFQLSALDSELDLPAGATRAQLEEAMEGHVLSQVDLTGYVQREGRDYEP